MRVPRRMIVRFVAWCRRPGRHGNRRMSEDEIRNALTQCFPHRDITWRTDIIEAADARNTRRGRKLLLVLAPLLAAGIIAAPHAQAVQFPNGWKLIDGGVVSYHPELNSIAPAVVDTATADIPVIRFDMEARIFTVPKKWRAVVELEKWYSAKELHRLRGDWVQVGREQRWGIRELPAKGHAYLHPAMTWACTPGAFVVYVQLTGETGAGSQDYDDVYFPWKNWHPEHLHRGDVYARPTLKAAFHTECKGGDRIHG